MASSKYKSSDFGEFLQEVRRHERSSTPGKQDPMKFLRLLADSGSLSVPELMEESEMVFADFVETLNALKGAGLINLVGQPGREVIELTPSGQQLARLADVSSA